ncbi:WG repeat-containing protein [Nostoc sp. UHCC 0702]|nr:WG repeat-containing protein [Nostoc sp. UHCC 0702]
MVINKNVKLVITLKFNSVEDLYEGLASVCIGKN